MGRKIKDKKKKARRGNILKSDIMARDTNITSTEPDETKTNGLTHENTKRVTADNNDAGISPGNDNNNGADSNQYNLGKDCLWSGVLGALVTLSVVVLVAYIIPGFRYSSYYVNTDPSQLAQLLSTNLSEQDSLYVAKVIEDETTRRKDLIEDLLDQGIIVSSEDYASNLSGYYNALIAVLAAVLVILNLFGFFAWRSNAEETLGQEKQKLRDIINDIDSRMEKNIEEVIRKNQVVKEKLEVYIQGIIDQENRLSEDEWSKIHLLLDKYKRKEVLMEISEDEKDNDGSIEEA